jgi:DNA (cytosine-5)-methyltransferase 1
VIVDVFSGWGWAEGLATLGLHEVGIELDPWACDTRAALGHATIRADVSTYSTAPFVGKVEGLIASPPCQSFSRAGKRGGLEDPRGQLVWQVRRWAHDLMPEWIACEQVPDVLPIWRLLARELDALGYSTWTGLLSAEQYGVPQTRERAILMASRTRAAVPPEPTHQRYVSGRPAQAVEGGMFGDGLLPWVSMAEALGWGQRTVNTRGDRQTPGGNEFDSDRPSWALTEKARSSVVLTERQANGARRPADTPNGNMAWTLHTNRDQREDGSRQTVTADRPAPSLTGKAGGQWAWERPSTTIAGDERIAWPGHHDESARSLSPEHGAVKLTLAEALVLQSFRPDLPVQGNKTERFRQVGNAVPALLAAAIVGALT